MSICRAKPRQSRAFVSLPHCITSNEIYNHINKNVKIHMPMIVLIAAHALRTSDTVNRVTLELHKIDTSSSVEFVLETSCGVASGVEYWSTLIKLSSQTVLCEDAVIVAVPGRFRDVFFIGI